MPARDPGYVARAPESVECIRRCGAMLPPWYGGLCNACARTTPPRRYCPRCRATDATGDPGECVSNWHVENRAPRWDP